MSDFHSRIEELVLLCSTQLPACHRLLNDKIFTSISASSIPLKMLYVDDERTKNFLLKAKITSLPLLLMKIGDDILEVKQTSYILKVLKDFLNRPEYQVIQQHQIKIQEPREDEEKPQQLFKAQIVYRTDEITISFITCDKFMNLDDNFDLTIVSENCRKVHFESDNYITVNITNINSLKKLAPILMSKKNILTVSKTKRLSDLVTAMCMFYIHRNTLSEIHDETSVPKKTLTELLNITDGY